VCSGQITSFHQSFHHHLWWVSTRRKWVKKPDPTQYGELTMNIRPLFFCSRTAITATSIQHRNQRDASDPRHSVETFSTSRNSHSMVLGVAVLLGAWGAHPGMAAATASPPALPPGVKWLQPADVKFDAKTIKQSAIVPVTPGDYVVQGETRFNGWFLSAERIIFKPDSKLIFTRQALDARPNLFIIAKEVLTEDQQHPGTVTWERPTLGAAPESGTAVAGTDNGGHESIQGGNGQAGKMGIAGSPGHDAPSITLVTLSVKGPAFVDLVGMPGGAGGKGQTGGRGGGGGYGNPASAGPIDCHRGAGNGGRGGDGGAGGAGGPSGDGGRGGVFTLITSDDNVASATRLLKVDTAGGQPGAEPGDGGDPGAGGSGGHRGQEAQPWCKDDGHDGLPGNAGSPGSRGGLGAPGKSGDQFVGAMTPASVTELLTGK
jgi:hypothetical protein